MCLDEQKRAILLKKQKEKGVPSSVQVRVKKETHSQDTRWRGDMGRM